MRIRYRNALVALAVLATLSACAHPRHVAVVADSTLYETLNAVHGLEQQALCGQDSCAAAPVGTPARTPGWSAEKSKAFNTALLPAVSGGRALTQLLADWKPGQPVPARLHDLIVSLTTSLSRVTADFPDGTTKTAILAKLGQAQSIALQSLDLALTVGGTH